MSTSYIPVGLRRQVIQRADQLCEYCLIHEADTFFGCEVDHIISEKHGGETRLDNLAYACLTCNRNKGSDIGSLVPGTDLLVRFFNPRIDRLADHFMLGEFDTMTIEPLSQIGEVTTRILAFNPIERRMERHALRMVGRYPTEAALKRMRGLPDEL